MAIMDDDAILRRGRLVRRAIACLLALALAYPLSAGPVTLLWSATGENKKGLEVLERVYGPIRRAPPPVRIPLELYVHAARCLGAKLRGAPMP